MKKILITTAIIAAVAATGAALAQAGALSSSDISTRLSTAGYTDVRELEFDDGLWEAEVLRADGSRGDVAVDSNGNVLDARSGQPLLAREALVVAIERAGYREVHDLDRDGAIWDADAVDAAGQRIELRVNGFDGSVLNAQVDSD
jgi:hypothetical protein